MEVPLASPVSNIVRLQPPPAHLGPDGARFWTATLRDFVLDSEALMTHLAVACGALDRLSECRETIKREGLTLVTRKGDVIAHPLLRAEASARLAFGQALRALRLQPAAEPTDPRVLKPGRR
jgi:phage terminase small subunit